MSIKKIEMKNNIKKIIINNHTDLSDLDVLDFISEVVILGKISNEGKSYCYLTSYKSGVVITARHHDKSGNNTFHITKDNSRNEK